MKTKNSLLLITAMSAIFLSGCTTTGPEAQTETVDFPIKFEGDCPSLALNENTSVKVSDAGQVRFVSDPEGKPFSLTFDPFVGRVYRAPQGQVRARISRQSLPTGTAQDTEFAFKFTIYSGACPPVDPKLIVTR